MNYDFKVVGIGLSAGGITPLLEILKEIPGKINAAIVIVMHFPINLPSNLDRIISNITPLNVVAVSTIEYLEAGSIYVLAGGKALLLSDRFLQVSERNPNEKINNTIDVFFKSMAADAKDKCIGVILSGAGSDGIEGAKKIEDNNGIVIVQDPETAKFPLMPQLLIANDHPDYVLSTEQIAGKIIQQIGADH